MNARVLALALALFVALGMAGDAGQEVATVFDAEADTGAFCIVPDLVPHVGASYKAMIVFEFEEPLQVLSINFPAPTGEEPTPAKVFTPADVGETTELVVELHDFDGMNHNGWHNALFEEFQFINGIVHSEPTFIQASVHIRTYEPLVRPANHNCPLPSISDEYFSLKPASYFDDVSESSSDSVTIDHTMTAMCRWIIASVIVMTFLLLSISIGYFACSCIVSKADEEDKSDHPDDELVFDCAVPMNQPSAVFGMQQPQYMPSRPVASSSPVVTYNVAVLV